ncbi:MAG: phosphatase PAP2 family protein [Rickettsiales bacterium]|nr:phosphatase PAP2 family protein [Rickettsiales bacterium]
MFLTKDNKIKWRSLGVAFVLVLLFCGIGVFWLDRPLLVFMRNFNWAGWQFFDTFFSFKAWVVASVLMLMASAIIKKIIDNRYSVQDTKSLKRQYLISNIYYLVSSIYKISLFVFCSVIASGVIAGMLKFCIGRMRPVFFESLGVSGFFPFMNEWAFNSMPSGHTAASFAGLVIIGLMFPKIKWATWTLAIIAGISRICIGDHWPSDVILGAFIGMAAADFVKAALANLKLKV